MSDKDERLVELNRLKTILAKNDYPPEVVEHSIKKFIENKTRIAVPEHLEDPVKKKRFLTLHYWNRNCEDFASRLKNLVESNYPQVEFNVAFQAPMTIGKLFPFKDNIKNVLERSCVVYCLKCETCGKQYIGKTDRILYHRMKEHSSKSPSNKSACREHILSHPDHFFDYNEVKVLDSADNFLNLRIKELLHILSQNSELNKQLGSQSSFEIKTILIQPYPQHAINN